MVKYELTVKEFNTDFEVVKVLSSKIANDVIRKFYFDDIQIYESCFIILLDAGNNTLGYAKISQGGIAGTVVDVKIIAKYVIESLAQGVIVAHNHPSGTLKPSEQDLTLTRNLEKTLKLMGTVLQDHLIVTKDGYYSFKDNGEL